MGALRRLVVPACMAAAVVAWRCQPEPAPYVLTVAEVNGILGDVGRASAILRPRAEGWHLTTSSAITDRDGRTALLHVHGASFPSPGEASAFYRSVAEELGGRRPADDAVAVLSEALDVRRSTPRPSLRVGSWRAQLLRVERYVALVEVDTPAGPDPTDDGSSGGAMGDGDCERILARGAALLHEKLLRAGH